MKTKLKATGLVLVAVSIMGCSTPSGKFDSPVIDGAPLSAEPGSNSGSGGSSGSSSGSSSDTWSAAATETYISDCVASQSRSRTMCTCILNLVKKEFSSPAAIDKNPSKHAQIAFTGIGTCPK